MILKADERVPVLIAGGSLVGLSTSLFLARLGVGLPAYITGSAHAGGVDQQPARTRGEGGGGRKVVARRAES